MCSLGWFALRAHGAARYAPALRRRSNSPLRYAPQQLALLLHRGCARHASYGLLASLVALVAPAKPPLFVVDRAASSATLPQPLALLLHRGCARHHSSGLLASLVALWLRSFTSAGSSRGSPVRRDRRVPRQPEPPRHVGRCRHANTGTAPYLPWLARRRQQSGATSPELQPRVGGGQSQAGTDVAWPSGESYVRKGASPLPYDIEPVDHLTGTQQYRRRGSLGSADDVDRVVDPVREVDVQPTSRPEHHSVSPCHAAVGMGSRVEGAFVRLHLRQPDRHRADSQLTTEQLRSHVDRGLSKVGQLGHDVTLMGPVRCPT